MISKKDKKEKKKGMSLEASEPGLTQSEPAPELHAEELPAEDVPTTEEQEFTISKGKKNKKKKKSIPSSSLDAEPTTELDVPSAEHDLTPRDLPVVDQHETPEPADDLSSVTKGSVAEGLSAPENLEALQLHPELSEKESVQEPTLPASAAELEDEWTVGNEKRDKKKKGKKAKSFDVSEPSFDKPEGEDVAAAEALSLPSSREVNMETVNPVAPIEAVEPEASSEVVQVGDAAPTSTLEPSLGVNKNESSLPAEEPSSADQEASSESLPSGEILMSEEPESFSFLRKKDKKKKKGKKSRAMDDWESPAPTGDSAADHGQTLGSPVDPVPVVSADPVHPDTEAVSSEEPSVTEPPTDAPPIDDSDSWTAGLKKSKKKKKEKASQQASSPPTPEEVTVLSNVREEPEATVPEGPEVAPIETPHELEEHESAFQPAKMGKDKKGKKRDKSISEATTPAPSRPLSPILAEPPTLPDTEGQPSDAAEPVYSSAPDDMPADPIPEDSAEVVSQSAPETGTLPADTPVEEELLADDIPVKHDGPGVADNVVDDSSLTPSKKSKSKKDKKKHGKSSSTPTPAASRPLSPVRDIDNPPAVLVEENLERALPVDAPVEVAEESPAPADNDQPLMAEEPVDKWSFISKTKKGKKGKKRESTSTKTAPADSPSTLPSDKASATVVAEEAQEVPEPSIISPPDAGELTLQEEPVGDWDLASSKKKGKKGKKRGSEATTPAVSRPLSPIQDISTRELADLPSSEVVPAIEPLPAASEAAEPAVSETVAEDPASEKVIITEPVLPETDLADEAKPEVVAEDIRSVDVNTGAVSPATGLTEEDKPEVVMEDLDSMEVNVTEPVSTETDLTEETKPGAVMEDLRSEEVNTTEPILPETHLTEESKPEVVTEDLGSVEVGTAEAIVPETDLIEEAKPEVVKDLGSVEVDATVPVSTEADWTEEAKAESVEQQVGIDDAWSFSSAKKGKKGKKKGQISDTSTPAGSRALSPTRDVRDAPLPVDSVEASDVLPAESSQDLIETPAKDLPIEDAADDWGFSTKKKGKKGKKKGLTSDSTTPVDLAPHSPIPDVLPAVDPEPVQNPEVPSPESSSLETDTQIREVEERTDQTREASDSNAKKKKKGKGKKAKDSDLEVSETPTLAVSRSLSPVTEEVIEAPVDDAHVPESSAAPGVYESEPVISQEGTDKGIPTSGEVSRPILPVEDDVLAQPSQFFEEPAVVTVDENLAESEPVAQDDNWGFATTSKKKKGKKSKNKSQDPAYADTTVGDSLATDAARGEPQPEPDSAFGIVTEPAPAAQDVDEWALPAKKKKKDKKGRNKSQSASEAVTPTTSRSLSPLRDDTELHHVEPPGTEVAAAATEPAEPSIEGEVEPVSAEKEADSFEFSVSKKGKKGKKKSHSSSATPSASRPLSPVPDEPLPTPGAEGPSEIHAVPTDADLEIIEKERTAPPEEDDWGFSTSKKKKGKKKHQSAVTTPTISRPLTPVRDEEIGPAPEPLDDAAAPQIIEDPINPQESQQEPTPADQDANDWGLTVKKKKKGKKDKKRDQPSDHTATTPTRSLSPLMQETDLTPAQATSHIIHEAPYELSPRPEKKLKVDNIEESLMLSEPILSIAESSSAPHLDDEQSDNKAEVFHPDDNFMADESSGHDKGKDIDYDDPFMEDIRPQASIVKKSKKEGPKSKGKEIETAASSSAVGGTVASLAEKFGGQVSRSKKKQKKKMILDKRTEREPDLFDDPILWETSDRKTLLGEEAPGEIDAFWGGAGDEELGKEDGHGAAEDTVREADDLWGGGDDEEVVKKGEERGMEEDAAREVDDFWGGGNDIDEPPKMGESREAEVITEPAEMKIVDVPEEINDMDEEAETKVVELVKSADESSKVESVEPLELDVVESPREVEIVEPPREREIVETPMKVEFADPVMEVEIMEPPREVEVVEAPMEVEVMEPPTEVDVGEAVEASRELGIAEPPTEDMAAEAPREVKIAEPLMEIEIMEPPREVEIVEPPMEVEVMEPPPEPEIVKAPEKLEIADEPIKVEQFAGRSTPELVDKPLAAQSVDSSTQSDIVGEPERPGVDDLEMDRSLDASTEQPRETVESKTRGFSPESQPPMELNLDRDHSSAEDSMEESSKVIHPARHSKSPRELLNKEKNIVDRRDLSPVMSSSRALDNSRVDDFVESPVLGREDSGKMRGLQAGYIAKTKAKAEEPRSRGLTPDTFDDSTLSAEPIYTPTRRPVSRGLEPVPEESTEEFTEKHKKRDRLTSKLAPSTPDVNRDSGFVADSPHLHRRSNWLEEGPHRDSGVHLKDWSGSPRTLSPERSSFSANERPQTSEKAERQLGRSPLPLGYRDLHEHPLSRTPVLREPSPRLVTPEPQKVRRAATHTPTPEDNKRGRYKELQTPLRYGKPEVPRSLSRSATASPAVAQRSVSDNAARSRLSPSPDVVPRRVASNTSLTRHKTPEPHTFRPDTPGSIRSMYSATPPLRRVDRRISGDLRSLSQRSQVGQAGSAEPPSSSQSHSQVQARSLDNPDQRSAQTTTPVANEGRVRSKDMTDVYVGSRFKFISALFDETCLANFSSSPLVQDGYGEGRIGSPRSPTRPHSMRRRQSMQVLELESKVKELTAENQMLAKERQQTEQTYSQKVQSLLSDRDAEIDTLKRSIELLNREVSRLTEVNQGLNTANAQLANEHNGRYRDLELLHAAAARELETTRSSQGGFEQRIRDKDAEIAELRTQLESAQAKIREMQQQILDSSKPADADFLDIHDVDYFDHRCQQLCQHVQQWVLRFSKFSDMRSCRLTSEINDEKIIDRLDNAVLDGSDVDTYLRDRVRRRDIFMSMTMNMIWEFVFTRYLFGMDREQRQKLKALEKHLTEIGPPHAVRLWRAVTLTLLSRRESFKRQRDLDTEAVVQAILETLSMILPPPSHLEDQIQSQLRRVMAEAVDLAIMMRSQRAEYMMLPPLQPEYNADGELVETVSFNAALMNERSGDKSATNDDLQAQNAIVRIVLFPLVVKKGDDTGVGDDEIVVSPAQVLIARSHRRKSRGITPSSDLGGAAVGASVHSLGDASYLEGGI